MAVLPLRAAVIDLGTNTFNLAVGQRGATGLELLHTESLAVGLGRGGIEAGTITAEAMQRALDALAALQACAKTWEVAEITAIGTSALRNADNAGTLQRLALAQLGLQLQIIDGLREADLIYRGVQASGALDQQDSLLIDIGGGSVEFIHGNRDAAHWQTSLEIGMARLHARFPLPDPITAEVLTASEAWLRERLGPVIERIQSQHIRLLAGSAGSFDTLIDLQNGGDLPAHPRWNALPMADFQHWYDVLLGASRAERAALPGMKPIRVDMMVYALLLIRLLAEATGAQEIQCCRWSLREGALVSALARA